MAYAKRVGAEFIAVGTRQPATLARYLFGGVSRRMLRAADAAGTDTADEVLAVRNVRRGAIATSSHWTRWPALG